MRRPALALAILGVCVGAGVLVGGGASLVLRATLHDGSQVDQALAGAAVELRSGETSAQMLVDRLAAIDGVDPAITSGRGSDQLVPIVDSENWVEVFEEAAAICTTSDYLWKGFKAVPPVCILSTDSVTVEVGWSFISGHAAVELAAQLVALDGVRTVSVGKGDDGQGRVLVTVDPDANDAAFRDECTALIRYAPAQLELVVHDTSAPVS